jgi:excisionase family DNA binding protein
MTANAPDDYSLTDWKPIAERLRLRERAFWKLVHEHGLPGYKINSRVWRFRMSEVQEWLINRKTGE